MPEDVDLGSLIADAKAAHAAEAPPAPPVAAAPVDAPASEPVQDAPASPDPNPPTPPAEPPPPPDQGTPLEAAPEAATLPEPTPVDSLAADLYRIAGIDAADPKAADKLKAFVEERKAQPAPAPAAPAQPATDEPPITEDDVIADFAERDDLCKNLEKQYTTEYEKAQKTAEKLTAVDSKISKLQAFLAPIEVDENLKRDAPDEYQASEAQRQLTNLQLEQFQLRLALGTSNQRAKDAATRYHQRLDAVRIELRERDAVEREIVEGSTQFAQGFQAAFESEFSASKLPTEERADVEKVVKREAKLQMQAWIAAGKGEFFKDIQGYIRGVIKSEADRYERHHRLRSGQYGQKKTADAAVAAPPPAVATGTPAATPAAQPNHGDPEALLGDIMRQARQDRQSRRG